MNALWKKTARCAAGLALACLPAVAGDENPSRFEIFLLCGPSLRGGAASYANAYDPHPGYKIPGSYVRQTLRAEIGAGWIVQAGLTYDLGRNWGVRLTLFSGARGIGGLNSPYEYLYKYTSTMPPDYKPVDTSVSRSITWPSSQGTLRERGGRLELVWRWPASSAFEISLAAGLAATSAGGSLYPLGFTELKEGSHGVLFIEDYLVYLRLPRRISIGPALGGEAGLRLTRHFRLRLQAAYQGTGAYRVAPEIDKVLSYYSYGPAAADVLERIRSRFDLQPFRIALGRAFFGAGLVFRFD